MRFVYGYGERKHKKDPDFYKSLDRVKRICGPGRGVDRLVVYKVYKAEYFFVMHQPVKKIEIGIVQKKHYRKNSKIICPSMIADIFINSGMRSNNWITENKSRNQAENTHG